MLLICSWHNNGCNCCVFANNEDVFRSDVLQAVEKLFKQNTCTIVRQMLLFRELLNPKRILHNQKSISTKWNLVASLEACFQVTWGFWVPWKFSGGENTLRRHSSTKCSFSKKNVVKLLCGMFLSFSEILMKINAQPFAFRRSESWTWSNKIAIQCCHLLADASFPAIFFVKLVCLFVRNL